MDKSIEQMSQDLARAEYSERTRTDYCRFAGELVEYVGKPVGETSREELRRFVDWVMAKELSSNAKSKRLSAVLFLYRKTLGQPEMVSFIKLPKVCSALPVVLSKGEVHRLFNNIRSPRYQALAMVMYATGLRLSDSARAPRSLRAPPTDTSVELRRANSTPHRS